MIIDFHTHIFPERIASKTIELLSAKGGIPAFSDGSEAGLLTAMERAGVDLAVTLPVVTNPSQFDSVNRYAKEVNLRYKNANRRLISFGGIHPACEDIEGKMRWLAAEGFLGVKIHPDYQGTYIDDEGYERILKSARELDMIVLTHAGYDVGFKGEPVKCTPERALRLIKKVPYPKFVLAHMGGNEEAADVLAELAGQDVYFDTAYVLRFIGKAAFCGILEKHGADKILFASDSPWSSICEDVKILQDFVEDERTREKIFFRNAKELLGI